MVRRELIIGGRDPLTPAASLFLRGWLRGLGLWEKNVSDKSPQFFIDYVSDS